MILLDTTFLIDLLRKRGNAIKKAEELLSRDRLCTTYINAYELMLGVFGEKDIDQGRRLKDVENLLDRLEVLGIDKYSAVNSAKIGGALMLEGKIIGDLDNMIAGIALSNNINQIVTRDKGHFSRIKGIKVEQY